MGKAVSSSGEGGTALVCQAGGSLRSIEARLSEIVSRPSGLKSQSSVMKVVRGRSTALWTSFVHCGKLLLRAVSHKAGMILEEKRGKLIACLEALPVEFDR